MKKRNNIEIKVKIKLLYHNLKKVLSNNIIISVIALLITLGFTNQFRKTSHEEIYMNALRMLLISMISFGFGISLIFSEWIRRDENHLYCLYGINRIKRYGILYFLNFIIVIAVFLIGIQMRKFIYG